MGPIGFGSTAWRDDGCDIDGGADGSVEPGPVSLIAIAYPRQLQGVVASRSDLILDDLFRVAGMRSHVRGSPEGR